MNYNAPFSERFKIHIEYIKSSYGAALLPSQTIFHTNKGRIAEDSIKYHINSFGQRGSDYSLEKPTDEIRIIFLGGSHIFDLNYYDYEGGDFTNQIMKKFNKSVRVINAGVPGHTMVNLSNRIKEDLIQYNPDIVIINSIWNDIKVISRYDTTLSLNPLIKKQKLKKKPNKNPLMHRVNLYDEIFGNSVIYRKMRDYYWYKRLNIVSDKMIIESFIDGNIANKAKFNKFLINKGLIKLYKNHIEESVKILQKNNIIPIIAVEERLIDTKNTIAEKRKIKYQMVSINTHDELVYLFENCDSLLSEIAQTNNLHYININNKIPHTLEYFADHIHTTAKGSKYMAEEYYYYLKPIVDSLLIVNKKNI
tara:strand:+ start:38 stop:1129 length:1092 start_codon:yes stop_codon:yes gene_type:complete